LGNKWLVGGASNSGGSVLRHFFSDEQIESLSQDMDISHPTGLDYYPLVSRGERFPVSDPFFEPKLTPRPDEDARFLQGIFEGLANIEKCGYQLLHQLGAPAISSLRSNGGGSNNPWFNQIRQQYLGVKMVKANHDQAAFGSALNALGSTDPGIHRIK
jgi:sugar (pentulose or hexulose) kinase